MEQGDLTLPTLVMAEVMAERGGQISVRAGLLWQRLLKMPGDDLTLFQQRSVLFSVEKLLFSPPKEAKVHQHFPVIFPPKESLF